MITRNISLFVISFFLTHTILSQSISDQLKQYFEGHTKYFTFNGNVLIAKGGNILYSGAHGMADYESKRMLNENTIFELASVSKQFTAMGILMLRDKGKLSLDDEIKKYFPSIPYQGITIKHLLLHTSGLPEYESQFEKHWDHKKIAFNKDIIDMLAARKDTLLFTPSAKWKYSNTGYALLASVIEKVTGKSFNDYMNESIFKPLGMKNTFVYNSRRSTHKMPENYALGFVYSDSLKQYILPDKLKDYDMVYYLDGIVGDGCVNSTIHDLYSWAKNYTENKLMTKESAWEMQSALAQTNPKDTNGYYGYGLFIEKNSPKGKVISHTGGWPGYRTNLIYKPKADETIIILSNNESNLPFFKAAIESLLNNEKLEMPYEHKAITIDPSLLKEYAGKFFSALTMEFVVKENKLYRRRNGTSDILLMPESNTKFFYTDGTDRQIDFIRDETGKVNKAWFINMGQKGEMKRID